MGIVWRLAMAGFLHVLLFVGAAELFPPPFAGGIEPEPAAQFLSLLGVGVMVSLALALVVRASAVRGLGLLASVGLLYGVLVVALPPWELLLFGIPEAPTGTASAHLAINVVQAVVWLPVATWMMARWAGPPPEDAYAGSLPGHLWLRIPGVVLAYVGLRLIGEQIAVLEAPEAAGFFGLGTVETSRWGWFAARGLLVALAAWPVVATLRGSWIVRGLVVGLAMAGFEAALWAAPSPLVEDAVRWPMMALAGAVAGAYGLFVGAAFTGRASETSGGEGTTVAQPVVTDRRSAADT